MGNDDIIALNILQEVCHYQPMISDMLWYTLLLDLKGFDRSELYGENFTQPMRRQHQAIKNIALKNNSILSDLQECLGG